MYIVLITVGAALAAYGLGAAVAGWIAGFVPALITAVAVAVLLVRRVSGQIRAVFEQAGAAMQAGRIPEARETLRSALKLQRWWFALPEQVHGQLGQIDYSEAVALKVQKKLTESKDRMVEAKTNLAKSWDRDWRARMALALVHHREGQVDAAVDVFKKASAHAEKEPLFWGVYAWVLHEARKREEALLALGEGLKGSPKHAGLTAMQEALSNKRRPDMTVWGEMWYSLFPEEIPQKVWMEMAEKAGYKVPKGPIPQKGPPPMRGGGRPR